MFTLVARALVQKRRCVQGLFRHREPNYSSTLILVPYYKSRPCTRAPCSKSVLLPLWQFTDLPREFCPTLILKLFHSSGFSWTAWTAWSKGACRIKCKWYSTREPLWRSKLNFILQCHSNFTGWFDLLILEWILRDFSHSKWEIRMVNWYSNKGSGLLYLSISDGGGHFRDNYLFSAQFL